MRTGAGSGVTGLQRLVGDHLGSTAYTTDVNGVKQAELRYKAWGETRYTSGTTPTTYRFTGQRSEEAGIGLYWYNSRWYDSALSRWTQPDTLVPVESQSTQAWDRYAFVNNNPTRYTDPSGHKVDDGCRSKTYTQNNKSKEFISDLPFDETLGGNVSAQSQTDDPGKPLTTADKIGMVATDAVLVISLSVAEGTLAIVGLGLLDAGPIGVAADIAVIAPIEIFLIDVEVSTLLYTSEVFSKGTKEDVDLRLTLIPAMVNLFQRP